MRRYIISYFVVISLLVALIFVNVSLGSVNISLSRIINIIFKRNDSDTFYQIIWNIRLPRILAAVVLGGALAVSGFLLQTFFQNPIAGPYVLGVSSGAKLFVAIVMIVMLDKGKNITSIHMIIAAFLGSICSMLFVLLMSVRVKKMSNLVICGILIGYICSAITDFLVTFAEDSNIVNLHNWSLGSFSGMNWDNIKVMSIIIFVTMIITFMLAKPISAYQMGENYAKNMGVNIYALRVILILLSSVLSACVVAFAGPISFVGIAVPQMVKLMLKTAKPLVLIPGCFLAGAAVTLFCDGFARTIFAPAEVSVSSVTAVFLVPVVIIMMTKKGKVDYGN